MGRGTGQHIEGEGQQTVARQNGGCLAEGLVDGRAAAAHVVVVHRGQVVMHQRVAMHHLQCTGRAHRAVFRHAEQRRRLHQQEGPQPLAAAKRAMADRGEQGGRAGGFARQWRWLQQGVEAGLEGGPEVFELPGEGGGVGHSNFHLDGEWTPACPKHAGASTARRAIPLCAGQPRRLCATGGLFKLDASARLR